MGTLSHTVTKPNPEPDSHEPRREEGGQPPAPAWPQDPGIRSVAGGNVQLAQPCLPPPPAWFAHVSVWEGQVTKAF